MSRTAATLLFASSAAHAQTTTRADTVRAHHLDVSTNDSSPSQFSRAALRTALALVFASNAVVTHPSRALAESSESAPSRQALEDAWWTGPILAPSAATLPQGHFLIEPYLYDSITYARYDADGERHDIPDTHFLGSQTYILYGLIDTVSVGVIPRFGFRDTAAGPDSSGIRVGDVSLQAQYRMTQFDGSMPTTSIVLQATLPTGKHDRLGTQTGDGMGGGAHSLMTGVYSQHFFWMPNGRILRARLNATYTFFDNADVNDVSVYGTAEGFRGRAEPGDSFLAVAAAEYSITRNWVLAMDVQYQRDARTHVTGSVSRSPDSPLDVRFASPVRESISVAPAIEYNFNGNVGIIVGAIWTAAGRNVDAAIIPVVAVNMVY